MLAVPYVERSKRQHLERPAHFVVWPASNATCLKWVWQQCAHTRTHASILCQWARMLSMEAVHISKLLPSMHPVQLGVPIICMLKRSSGQFKSQKTVLKWSAQHHRAVYSTTLLFVIAFQTLLRWWKQSHNCSCVSKYTFYTAVFFNSFGTVSENTEHSMAPAFSHFPCHTWWCGWVIRLSKGK